MIDDTEVGKRWYVRENNSLSGEYKNKNTTTGQAIQSVDNKYYLKTYGSNTNVEIHSVPLYWQSDKINLRSGELDPNKNFTKYFIVVVSWNDEEQRAQEKKETDILTLSVTRTN